MLLNIVSDEQLLTSEIVKTILLVLICLGFVFNIYRIIKGESMIRRVVNFMILIFLMVSFFIVLREYRIEKALLNHPKYVTGFTTGYCSVFGEGEGIAFKYTVEGMTYIGCNTYHPISKNDITVPGGEYRVRYSDQFREKGRMIFLRE